MAEAAAERFGGIDLLVNNAAIFGGMKLDFLLTVDWEYLQRFLEVNLIGALVCTRACYPSMAARGGGASSTSRRRPRTSTPGTTAGPRRVSTRSPTARARARWDEHPGERHRPGAHRHRGGPSVVPEEYMSELVGRSRSNARGPPRTWSACACSCCRTTPVGDRARLQRRRRPGHAPVTECSRRRGRGRRRRGGAGHPFNRPEARNAFNFALYDAVTRAITDAAEATGMSCRWC